MSGGLSSLCEKERLQRHHRGYADLGTKQTERKETTSRISLKTTTNLFFHDQAQLQAPETHGRRSTGSIGPSVWGRSASSLGDLARLDEQVTRMWSGTRALLATYGC